MTRKTTLTLASAALFALSALAHAAPNDDFFRAVEMDNPSYVRSQVQRGLNPNTVNAKGVPALYVALQEGALRAAQALIESPGIDLNAATPTDETPLMMAALKGQTELLRTLIARGARVNKSGWTPLHYAASAGQLPALRALLDAGADVNARSPNGTTPLMMAARYGSDDAVVTLLNAGADPALKNQLDLSALDFADSADRSEAAKAIETVLRRRPPASSAPATPAPKAAPTAAPAPTTAPTSVPAPAQSGSGW